MQRIYLDHNSTTPIDPRVAEAIFACHQKGYVNPASQHQSGQRVRQELESVRSQILQWLGAQTSGMNADRLIFTSGGTESNNLALLGLAGTEPGRVLLSSIEHPSLFGPAELLAQRGFEVVTLPVTRSGVVEIDQVRNLINADTLSLIHI